MTGKTTSNLEKLLAELKFGGKMDPTNSSTLAAYEWLNSYYRRMINEALDKKDEEMQPLIDEAYMYLGLAFFDLPEEHRKANPLEPCVKIGSVLKAIENPEKK